MQSKGVLNKGKKHVKGKKGVNWAAPTNCLYIYVPFIMWQLIIKHFSIPKGKCMRKKGKRKSEP